MKVTDPYFGWSVVAQSVKNLVQYVPYKYPSDFTSYLQRQDLNIQGEFIIKFNLEDYS